jgi:hypothetical protein
MMAPEEILSSTDASRRDFLKKVLVGTTFAAPVIASFSMEGLSPETASAISSNQCSNMTTSRCCQFAAQIAAGISALGFCGLVGQKVSLESQAALLGPLGEAQAAMAKGLDKGKGDCTNKPAQGQFKKAAKKLEEFKDLVAILCVDALAKGLTQDANLLIGAIDDLLDGVCADGALKLLCTV